MKKTTNTKEYDIEGRLIKETTITEEMDDFKNVVYPNYPANPHLPNTFYYDNPNPSTYTPKITC